MSAAEQLVEDIVGPQAGPQTVFATTTAQIAIIGGGAGGGKSISLLYEPAKLTALERVRGMHAVLFRRNEKDLKRGGQIWDKSQSMYRAFGGKPRTTPSLDWVFEASSRALEDRHRIEFRHLQRESSIFSHDGTEYDLIGFDELQQFTGRQWWYMFTRLRSTSGLQPRIRATCNPLPDSWLFELVRWWIGSDGYAIPERSGVVRWFVRDPEDESLAWYDSEADALIDYPRQKALSFTFIVASLDDNPALERANPHYRANLQVASRADRARLLGEKNEKGKDRGGNWLVRDSAGDVFKRSEFKIVDGPPSKIVRTVRFWDRAATSPTPKHPDPDWSRAPRVSLCEGGEIYMDDLASMRSGPVKVLRFVQRTAVSDGVRVEIGLWQDTGGAGKTDAEITRDALTGFSVQIEDSFGAGSLDPDMAKPERGSSRAKRVFANVWSPIVERGDFYMRRAGWNGEVLAEADAFPYGVHDDIIDGISGAIQVLVGQGLGFWNGLVGAAEALKTKGRTR